MNMEICVRRLCLLAALLCLLVSGAAAEITMAWMGDTCGSLSEGYGALAAQLEWITEHAQEENIGFAVHAGDIVCEWEAQAQWREASKMLAKLDGKVAYSLLAGYDKIVHQTQAYQPFTDGYAKRRMHDEGVTWYDGGRANAQLLAWESGQILILSLSERPSVDELRWADETLARYAHVPAILCLNRYLNGAGQTGTIGAGVRDALLHRHEQVKLVLCTQGTGASFSVWEETCETEGKMRSVPVLGIGKAALPQECKALWLLRLNEKAERLTLEYRRIGDEAAQVLWAGTMAGWFRQGVQRGDGE